MKIQETTLLFADHHLMREEKCIFSKNLRMRDKIEKKKKKKKKKKREAGSAEQKHPNGMKEAGKGKDNLSPTGDILD
jgi:hypothetical protein